MLTVLGVLVLTAAGAGAGWACRRVFVRPFVQSISAALVGYLIGSIGIVFVVIGSAITSAVASGQGGLGAASAGSEGMILGAIFAIVATGSSQLAIWRVGPGGRSVFNKYRPVVLGAATALASALLAARGIAPS